MEMCGESLTHEKLRMVLWIRLAAAVAGASNCTDKKQPASWANETLKEFDKAFPEKETNGTSAKGAEKLQAFIDYASQPNHLNMGQTEGAEALLELCRWNLERVKRENHE